MPNKMVPTMTTGFFIMVVGQIISIFGSSLLRFGFSLYILDTTGREDIFAILLAVSFLPMLLTPVGGAIADRFNRKNLMVIVDAVNAVLTLAFIILLILNTANIILIGVIMLLLGVIGALEQPTCSASVPALVPTEKLEAANGIVSGVGAISGMLAPVTGGILYGILGINLLSVLCLIAFIFAAIMESFIKMPFTKREQTDGILSTLANDLKAGMAYVIKQSLIMKTMVTAAALNFLLVPFFTIGTPIILRITMQTSDLLYGLGMALFELATILGAIAVGFLAHKLAINSFYRWIIIIALLLLPMAFSLTPTMLSVDSYPSYILYFTCAVPIMMILTMLSIYIITVVQKRTPNEMLGKVLAIITAAAQCAAPLGQILWGFAFKSWSSQVYIITLALAALMLIIAISIKRLFANETESKPMPTHSLY